MPDPNPEEYTTGYIMPVLSPDIPAIVAPFTAEKFREANDIASKTVVQTSISDIQDNIDTIISPNITGIQDDIENNIKPSITGIQDDIREYIGDIREYIGDIQTDIEGNIKGDITSTIALGGIAQNATFTGKTALEILAELLNVEGFPVAPGLPTIMATMTVNGNNAASSYQLGETLETVRISGSNPDRKLISQYKTYSGELLDLTKFKYYNSESETIETIAKDDAYYAGNFQQYKISDEYINERIIEDLIVGPHNSYSYTVYGEFADGNIYVGTKRTTTDYSKNSVQYKNVEAARAKASVSFTVTIPWFARDKDHIDLVYQSDKNFSFTSLPMNSMSTSSTTGGIEALNESTDSRMAFLVPTAWFGSKSFKIYQFNETSKTYDIDRTGIFESYAVTYNTTTKKFTKDIGGEEIDLLSDADKANIKGNIAAWTYIVHEGDPISNWKLFLKKE